MKTENIDVVLASGSPRRKELLEQIGVKFRVIRSECDEVIRESEPDRIVMQLSADKAHDVARRLGSDKALIIGADTIVVCDGKILGKPADASDAARMLGMINGRVHSVFTGVTVIYGDKSVSFAEETKVNVIAMSNDEIAEYISTKDPMDKAGAYGIQGYFARYVSGIEGDYNNVVGLPVSRLMSTIKEM